MRKIAIVLLTLFSIMTTQGQVASLRVGIPSPTAASLAKHGDIPVSLYTGTPNIDIPLYVVEGKTLRLPITLRYHASGVKVEEIAGWVGLGWSLDAGGVITRTVRGLPDDSQNGYYFTGQELHDVWDNFDEQAYGEPPDLDAYEYVQFALGEIYDPEPDHFFYSFAGRSGKFVFHHDQTIRTIPHQNWNIDVDIESGYYYNRLIQHIERFIVTVEDGTRYIFQDLEPTRVTNSQSDHNVYISSWYLSEIHSTSGEDKIFIEYHDPVDVEHEMRIYEEKNTLYSNFHICPSPSPVHRYQSYQHKSLRIERIISDREILKFHSGTPRLDALSPEGVEQEYKLDSIEVIQKPQNGDVIKKLINFNYDYFNLNKQNARRLRLDEVKIVGDNGTSQPPYKFQYNTSVNLPSRFSHAVDHWGFYNGKHSNNTLIPAMIIKNPTGNYQFFSGSDRSPDIQYTKAGLLKTIEYPTGGKTELEYEQHDYSHVGNKLVSYGPDDRLKRINAGPMKEENVDTLSLSSHEPVPFYMKIDFILPNGMKNNDCFGGYCAKLKVSGPNGSTIYTEDINTIILFDHGTYVITAKTTIDDAFVEGTFRWQDMIQTSKLYGGGVRIKSIIDSDGMGNQNAKSYNYKWSSGSGFSSGSLVNEPRYYYKSPSDAMCQYVSRSGISVVAPGITQGSVIGYSRVEVIYNDNGTTFHRTHRFSDPGLYPDNYPSSDYWPFGSRTSYDWKRGLEIEVVDFNKDDVKQRKKYTQYYFKDEREPEDSESTREIKALSLKTSPDGNYQIYRKYTHISSWVHPEIKTIEMLDQSGQNKATTEKKYYYENNNHLQPTKIIETNSDSTKRITEYKYAHEIFDDGDGNDYTPMAELNMLSQPYSVTVKNEQGDDLSKQWTTWSKTIPGNSNWLPKADWSWNGSGTTAPVNPSQSTSVKTTEVTLYDSYGNVLRMLDALGNETRYYYGSNTQPFNQTGINGVNGVYLTGIQKVIGTSNCDNCGTRPSSGTDLFIDARYDNYGRLNRMRDENNMSTFFGYDSFHRLNSVRNHTGSLLTDYLYKTNFSGSNYSHANSNYIRTRSYDGSQTIASFQFFDGLGRSIQTQQGIGGGDVVVQHYFYDALGREAAITNPIIWNTNLEYKLPSSLVGSNWQPGDALATNSAIYQYYMSLDTHVPDDAKYAYSQTAYYADPLNRVAEITAPGYIYRMNAPTKLTIRNEYGTNNLDIEAFLGYGKNQLFRNTTIDENNSRSWSFTDGWGRTVAQVVDFDNNGYVSSEDIFTGFEYDVLDRLVKVHEPKGWGTSAFKREYNYDKLGRLTS